MQVIDVVVNGFDAFRTIAGHDDFMAEMLPTISFCANGMHQNAVVGRDSDIVTEWPKRPACKLAPLKNQSRARVGPTMFSRNDGPAWYLPHDFGADELSEALNISRLQSFKNHPKCFTDGLFHEIHSRAIALSAITYRSQNPGAGSICCTTSTHIPEGS